MTKDERIDSDAYFKRIHEFPVTIADLVRVIRDKVDGAPELPYDLDCNRLDRLSGEHVDDQLTTLLNDMVCRVPFRDSIDRFLWMAIMPAFQSDRQHLRRYGSCAMRGRCMTLWERGIRSTVWARRRSRRCFRSWSITGSGHGRRRRG